jgi:hypothetical protein
MSGVIIHRAVASEETRIPNPEPHLNVDPDEVHLVLTGLELDIIVDALRSVGNVDLADRLEAVLRLLGQNRINR